MMLDKAKPILFNTEMVKAILDGRKTETRRPIKKKYDNSVFELLHGHLHECEPKTPDVIHEDGSRTIKVRAVVPCKPPYQKGDILYVRETWGNWSYDDPESNAIYYQYRADYPDGAKTYMYDAEHECDLPKWHPSIHMPKEAARIFLKVTDIKVERIQDITDEGAIAEGISRLFDHLSDEEYECWAKNVRSSGFDVGEKSEQSWLNYLWHGHEDIAKKQIASWEYQYSGYDSARDSFSSLWQKVYGDWSADPWVWVINFERLEVSNNG